MGEFLHSRVKFDKKSSDYRVLLVNYEVNEAIEKEINNHSQRPSSVVSIELKIWFKIKRVYLIFLLNSLQHR